jgi:hypothetical protein
LVAAGIVVSQPAQAATLQYPTDCKVGMRVKDHDGRVGTVTRFDASWSYCYVRMDGAGGEVGYLYSLLEPAGGGISSGASGLAAGVYECMGNGEMLQAPVRITGPGAYAMAGQSGRFRLEGSGKIVWLSGPLKPYFGKLLSGGRIGINDTGENFYPTSCDLNRTLR